MSIADEHLIDTTNYFIQLQQYLQYFDRRDILLLDFDDLIRSPRQVLCMIYEFLGISNTYFPDEYDVKNATKPRSEAELKLARSKLGAIAEYVPKPIKRAGMKVFRSVFPPPEKRVLTEAEREFVYTHLKEGMADLHRVFGFDVRKWGFDV